MFLGIKVKKRIMKWNADCADYADARGYDFPGYDYP